MNLQFFNSCSLNVSYGPTSLPPYFPQYTIFNLTGGRHWHMLKNGSYQCNICPSSNQNSNICIRPLNISYRTKKLIMESFNTNYKIFITWFQMFCNLILHSAFTMFNVQPQLRMCNQIQIIVL